MNWCSIVQKRYLLSAGIFYLAFLGIALPVSAAEVVLAEPNVNKSVDPRHIVIYEDPSSFHCPRRNYRPRHRYYKQESDESEIIIRDTSKKERRKKRRR